MENIIDPVIRFILSHQEANGSFPTYESYPVVNPSAGWTKLPDSSPFITANILFALLQLNDARQEESIQRAAQSLIAVQENNGFWRFWPVKSKQHPVPLDMDDTCIVRYVLARCGYTYNNAAILLNNQNAEGYFETWLKPRISNFAISPSIAFAFIKDYWVALPTLKLGHFTYHDKEPAVAANAVLYLGENKNTKACIDLILQEVISGTIPQQFYDDEIVVYYHISRAYVNGISGFEQLGPVIAERIFARLGNLSDVDDEMLWSMAANVLLDYKLHIELAKKMLGLITEGRSYPDKWLSHPYFCSKDRNFLSGSPDLTAAVFIEACAKLSRLK